MSHAVLLQLDLEQDGRHVAGYPIVAGVTVDHLKIFRMARTPDGIYEPLPVDPPLTAPQILLLRTDHAARVRLAGQQTSNIPINGGGILLVFGGAAGSNPDPAIVATVQTHLDGIIGA
jgi:hypothetical protein